MKNHNPNCEGDKCTAATGEVRRLPTGGDGGQGEVFNDDGTLSDEFIDFAGQS